LAAENLPPPGYTLPARAVRFGAQERSDAPSPVPRAPACEQAGQGVVRTEFGSVRSEIGLPRLCRPLRI